MGVYVKGMEMPETCKLCYLSEFDPGFYAYVCKPTGMRIDYDMAKIDRPKKICPLVPVPEHGRLIDADAFLRTIRPICDEDANAACTFETVKRLMVEHINNAPTIIPAESKEEEMK